MKIINFVGEKIGNGGIESFLANVSRGLSFAADKVDFIVVAQHKEHNIYENIIKENGGKVEYLSKEPCGLLQYYMRQFSFYNNNKDAVVWIHASYPSQYLYALAAKVCGVKKVIYHMHSVPNPKLIQKKKIRYSIIKLLLHNVPDVNSACSIYSGDINFGKNKYQIVHDGIDCDRYKFNPNRRVEIRNKFGIDEGTVLLGQIGRLTYAKNQLFAIHLLKRLIQDDKKVKLFIIGNGEDYSRIEEEVSQLKLAEHVIMVPASTEVEMYYSAIDVVLFPSIFEGLGIVPLEAQCSGLSVICSENVTDEVILTDNVRKIRLSDMDSWIKTILEIASTVQSREYNSSIGIDKVKEAGFTYANAYQEIVSISNS